MSILIKGIEMPTRCEDCFCYRHNAEYDYAYCNISLVNVLGHGNARLANCPLVPVSPHGRLIDADAAIANRNKDTNWCYDLCDLPEYLSDCPTIIPAEEGET